MLNHIPTYVIAGALGAGKTRFIQDLLTHKPAGEHWAVLINEFGQIGLDAALLNTAKDGVSISEIAGGCLCCTNGAPFEIGLSRLLKRAKPDRLLIEPSGLAHPDELMKKLSKAPWDKVLSLAPAITVMDVHTVGRLNEAQEAFLSTAPYLVLTKGETLDAEDKKAWHKSFAGKVIHWRMHEPLPLHWFTQPLASSPLVATPTSLQQMPQGMVMLGDRYCATQHSAEGFAIGWRFSPSNVFSLTKLETFLSTQPFIRAKLVIHSEQGWMSCNLNALDSIEWHASLWRNDSRIELIYRDTVDKSLLTQHIENALWIRPSD